METRTAGSASGLGKRTGSNPDTAPQADSTPRRLQVGTFWALVIRNGSIQSGRTCTLASDMRAVTKVGMTGGFRRVVAPLYQSRGSASVIST